MKDLNSPHEPSFEETCHREKGLEGLPGQRGNEIGKKLSHLLFSLGNLCTATQKVPKYFQHSAPEQHLLGVKVWILNTSDVKVKGSTCFFFQWMYHFSGRVSWTSELVALSPEKPLSGMTEGESFSTAALKSAFTMCTMGP